MLDDGLDQQGHEALTRKDHTGSRPIEWLTEVDRRRHTCMIDASIYVMVDGSSSVMNGNGKVISRPTVLFNQTV